MLDFGLFTCVGISDIEPANWDFDIFFSASGSLSLDVAIFLLCCGNELPHQFYEQIFLAN